MIRLYNVHNRTKNDCIELDAIYNCEIIATSNSIKEIETKIHGHANGKPYRIRYIL